MYVRTLVSLFPKSFSYHNRLVIETNESYLQANVRLLDLPLMKDVGGASGVRRIQFKLVTNKETCSPYTKPLVNCYVLSTRSVFCVRETLTNK